METDTSKIGQKIKRYRLINDIRQEDMAEKMGVSRATLINYEKGHTAINIDVLNTLKKNYPDFKSVEGENTKPRILIDNTIDFKVLFNVLIEKKFYIFLTSIFFIVLGTSSSFLFTKYYKAEISLYPAKKDLMQGFGQFQSLAANFGMNSTKNDQNFNIPDVVKSRLIATKVVKEKWLRENGQYINLIDLWKLNEKNWLALSNDSPLDSTLIIEKAVKKFSSHINVSEDRISGLIKISTTFQDPLISSNIANFIGSQVELYIQRENSAQSKKEKKFISERLFIVKSELEKAEVNLKIFKERNRGYDESPELFMIFSQLNREVEVKKEVYLTLQQQLELARIEEVKQSPILHVLDYAVPPTRKSSPNRIAFLVLSGIFGFLLSSIKTIFKY